MGTEKWMTSNTTKFISNHISVPIKQNFHPLKAQGLNTNYYAGKMEFKFIVPLNAFTNVRCTEAGSMWGIKRSIQCTETGIEWLRDECKVMICFESLYLQASKQISMWNITDRQNVSNRIQTLIIKRKYIVRNNMCDNNRDFRNKL